MPTLRTLHTLQPGDGRTLSFKSGVGKVGRRWAGRPRYKFQRDTWATLAAWFVIGLFFLLLAIGLSNL